jgi:hypothetical protein
MTAKAVVSLLILVAAVVILIKVVGLGGGSCPPGTYCPSPGGYPAPGQHYVQQDPEHEVPEVHIAG